jgi:hypothetical protein
VGEQVRLHPRAGTTIPRARLRGHSGGHGVFHNNNVT